MKTHFLGIDPGIANTGYCLLNHTKKRPYHCVKFGTIRTKPDMEMGERLNLIDKYLCELNSTYLIEDITIENVFFNRNVKSAMMTAKVIGIVEMIAWRNAIPIRIVTPQQVKKASGFGGKATKKEIITIMSKIVKTKMRNEHEADACAAATYGILNYCGENKLDMV